MYLSFSVTSPLHTSCNAVSPTLSLWFTSAPFSNKIAIAFAFPQVAAYVNGVIPESSVSFTFAPIVINATIVSTSSSSAASWSGEDVECCYCLREFIKGKRERESKMSAPAKCLLLYSKSHLNIFRIFSIIGEKKSLRVGFYSNRAFVARDQEEVEEDTKGKNHR